MKEGFIKNVFFATDSDLLLKDAAKYIEDQDALVTVHNVQRESFADFLRDGHDSFKMRSAKGMHTAVLEWYMLGEADYCMSPTDELSTFSKVSKFMMQSLYRSMFSPLPLQWYLSSCTNFKLIPSLYRNHLFSMES